MLTQDLLHSMQFRLQKHYLTIVQAISMQFKKGGDASVEATIKFDAEWEQIRQIWHDALLSKNPESIQNCLNIAVKGEDFLRFYIPSTLLIELLDPLPQFIRTEEYQIEHMSVLYQLADAYQFSGNFDKAVQILHDLLQLAQEQGQTHYESLAYKQLAIISYRTKKFEEGLRYCKRILKMKNDIDEETLASAYLWIGVVYTELRKYEQAETMLKRGLNLYQELNHMIGIANSYNNYAILLRRLGAIERARTLYTQALNLHKKMNNRRNAGDSLYNLGNIANTTQQFQEARYYYELALDYYEASGVIQGSARVLNNLGTIMYRQKNYDMAVHYFQAVIDIRMMQHDPTSLILPLANLHIIYYENEQFPQALEVYQKLIFYMQEVGELKTTVFAVAAGINFFYVNKMSLERITELLAYVSKFEEILPQLPTYISDTQVALETLPFFNSQASSQHWQIGLQLTYEEVIEIINNFIAESSIR